MDEICAIIKEFNLIFSYLNNYTVYFVSLVVATFYSDWFFFGDK